MTWRLRAFAALAEDSSSVPSEGQLPARHSSGGEASSAHTLINENALLSGCSPHAHTSMLI